MKTKIKTLLVFFSIISRINWFRFFQLYNNQSKNIIWIFPLFPKNIKMYLRSYMFLFDMAMVRAFLMNKKDFHIIAGKEKIKNSKKKNIFFNCNYFLKNLYVEGDHSKNTIHIVHLLEKRNNVFPTSKEAMMWENKTYMHKQFELLNINTPFTVICNSREQVVENKMNYPFLIKEVHSAGSKGLHKISSKRKLETMLNTLDENQSYPILVQELIDMSMDLRVIIIGNKIVLHYWRKNIYDDWMPTSTCHGSVVKFDNFPEKWRGYIMEAHKKLGLSTSAFDITWRNDNLNTEPYILEVSPAYMPNPIPPKKFKKIPYFQYKKYVFIKKPYYKEYIKIAFTLKEKLIRLYFDKLKRGFNP